MVPAAAANWPAGHAEQCSATLVFCVTLPNLPGLQSLHSSCPCAAWKLPTAHLTQYAKEAGDALLLPNFPAEQGMHEDCPMLGWYCPSVHGLHPSEFAPNSGFDLPAEHFSHW
jgi:hypothetical protein